TAVPLGPMLPSVCDCDTYPPASCRHRLPHQLKQCFILVVASILTASSGDGKGSLICQPIRCDCGQQQGTTVPGRFHPVRTRPARCTGWLSSGSAAGSRADT